LFEEQKVGSLKLKGLNYLNEYEFCIKCGKVLVKRVFKKYNYKPVCTACRSIDEDRQRGFRMKEVGGPTK